MASRPFTPVEPESLSQAVDRLTAAGWTHALGAVAGGRLRDLGTGVEFDPDELRVDESVRIEGPTDPGDEALVLALSDRRSRLRATWSVAFGAQATEADAEVLRRLGPTRDTLAAAPARHG
jgi:hypothetical protein